MINRKVKNYELKEPEPVKAWSSVKVIEHFGIVCPQKYTYTQKIVGSDDCLYLNVYTTNLNPCELKSCYVLDTYGWFFFWFRK